MHKHSEEEGNNDCSEVSMTRHVVAYLDILGYRRIVEDAFKAGRGDEELRKLKTAWDNSQTARSRGENWPSMPAARFFTDNIVIATQLLRETDAAGLQFLMFEVAALQWELIEHGYFLRGAIEIGDLYIDDRIVFGPGLLGAYDAEHKTAKWPRVILTGQAQECAQAALQEGGNFPLVKSSDGILSVDYLEDRVFIAGGDDRPFHEILTDHREILTKQLTRFRRDPDIWTKYFWLAQYHNAFCEKFQSHFPNNPTIQLEHLNCMPEILAEAPKPHYI